MSQSRWRLVLGLVRMLAAIAQSAAAVRDPVRLEIVLVLVALMLVTPGPGAVIGVIWALVLAGMRLPVRRATAAAVVIRLTFLAADFWSGGRAATLVNTALTATGRVSSGRLMLLGLSPGMDVVAAVADGDEALDGARRYEPDVVLMDLRMPRTGGYLRAQAVVYAVHHGLAPVR